jgi:hypothetical protein
VFCWQLSLFWAIVLSMGRQSKDDWLRDIEARQRNVVFPDIVQNEGRFWRNIYSGRQSLALSQWLGILILLASLIVCLTTLWPRGEDVWWHKVIDGYGIFAVLTIAFVAFIVVGNRRARRKASKH